MYPTTKNLPIRMGVGFVSYIGMVISGLSAYAEEKEPWLPDLGDGRLEKVWIAKVGDLTTPLRVRGQVPKNMRDKILMYDRKSREILCLSAISGEELWKSKPKAPDGFDLRSPGIWAGRYLILNDTQNILAIDSEKNGKIKWTRKAKVQLVGIHFGANDSYVVVGDGVRTIELLEASSGKQKWALTLDSEVLEFAPMLADRWLIVLKRENVKTDILVVDTKKKKLIHEMRITKEKLEHPLLLPEGLLIFITNHKQLHSFDVMKGKPTGTYEFRKPVTHLVANSGLLLAGLQDGDLECVLVDELALAWFAKGFEVRSIKRISMSREHVFTFGGVSGGRGNGQLLCQELKGGKLRFISPYAPNILAPFVCRNHLVTARRSYNSIGQPIQMVTVLGDKTGKKLWTCDLKTNSPSLFVFNGGLAIGEGLRLTGYRTQNPEWYVLSKKKLESRLRKNPKDHRARLRLAKLKAQTGELDKALESLVRIAEAKDGGNEIFDEAFTHLMLYRSRSSKKKKRTLPFRFLKSAPKIDGVLSDWKGISPEVFDSWRYVHIQEEGSRTGFTRDTWTGPSDHAIRFWSGYDKNFLYFALVVTDDIHKNSASNGVDLWSGDSVQVAFDFDRDTSIGFHGRDFELGLALNDEKKVLRWRWVENGRYVMKPLDVPGVVKRDEKAKKTTYEFALPHSYLGMTPSANLRFGFTFMVNDLDKKDEVISGIAPSPGIWNPKHPGQYAIGELVKK